MRRLGVCYYPEQWSEDIWARDARQMVDAGLSWVRVGEFAWSRLEPHPGTLRFEWLDRAIDVLGAAGLSVILGTPTATPPRWMLTRHPDMLAVDREGRRRGFGSRRHYCFSHLGYRGECERIVTLYAERYGAHEAVEAWQTDNEYGCHETSVSYSPAAGEAFQRWLAARYGSVDALNAAWGTVFWSMEYRAFEEIGLPNLTVTEPHPAHVLDFRRFTSDQVVSFNRRQVEIIREHSDRPIAHNFMGRETGFDHHTVGADLDIASWDSYPLGFLEDRIHAPDAWKRTFMAQGDPDFQAFHHDLYRGTAERLWVMEQQPGPVNWAPANPNPRPGMVRLWSWEAFAHGADAVLYFRWRQAPFGQEQMHAGLLRPDSVPAPGLAEVAETAREVAEAPHAEPAEASVALLFDYPSAWAWETQPQGAEFDYFDLVFEAYRGLRRLGLDIDIVRADAEISGYRMVVAPGLFAWSDPLRAALSTFDGIAVIGPRSGSRSESFQIPETLGPDVGGLDLKVAYSETLRRDVTERLEKGGAFKTWIERCEGGATVLERTVAGRPAVMAEGGYRYLAGWPDAAAMLRLFAGFAQDAGIGTMRLPDGVRVRRTDRELFVFNYGSEAAPAETVPGLKAPLPAAGVARLPLAG
ncbi:MAG: beta-galactosidase [Pseudomonadota bacterium]